MRQAWEEKRIVDFLPGNLDYKEKVAHPKVEPVRELHLFKKSFRGFLARRLIKWNMKVRKKILLRAQPTKASESLRKAFEVIRLSSFQLPINSYTEENLTVTDLTQQLQDMREEYDGVPLRKSDLSECPLAQFSNWLLDAQRAKVADPNACSLSTVDESGAPMARAVLLKGLEFGKFSFYTNYKSRKAKHLEINPMATMHFPWFSLERQVIVSGSVEKVSVDQSEEYFNSRPLMSRLGAWASQQSEVA